MVVPDYKCYVLSKSSSNTLAFLGFVAILGALTSGTLLVIGEKAPKGSEMWNIVGGIAAGVCTIAALGVYFSSRMLFRIRGNDLELSVEIVDRNLSHPVVVSYPFTMRLQWTDSHMSRRQNMKRLYLSLCDENNYPQLTFCTALGTMYDAPYGSEYINLLNSEESVKLVIADRIYDTGKTEDIQIEIGMRIKYIERRRAREAQTQKN